MKNLPKLDDIFPSIVVEQIKIALKEVGEISPWFDKEVDAWVFEHVLYPESYGGASPEEVIAGYPLYLANLIQARMEGTLAPWVEKTIKGRGGKRPGAGRPVGSQRAEEKVGLKVPKKDIDLFRWLRDHPEHRQAVRNIKTKLESKR